MFCNRFGGYGFGGFRGGPSFIMMILMIAILVLAVYFIYKTIGGKNHNFGASSSKAMDILNERFAKGEINEEEYLAKKKQLKE